MTRRSLIFILTVILLSHSGSAQIVSDLRKDLPENHKDRKEMLDMLRARMKKEAHVNAVFEVRHFKMLKDWAWVMVNAQSADGKPIDLKDDFLDCCHAEALFQKVKGKWYFADYGAFSTDVWWEGIAFKHPKAPRVIFDELSLR